MKLRNSKRVPARRNIEYESEDFSEVDSDSEDEVEIIVSRRRVENSDLSSEDEVSSSAAEPQGEIVERCDDIELDSSGDVYEDSQMNTRVLNPVSDEIDGLPDESSSNEAPEGNENLYDLAEDLSNQAPASSVVDQAPEKDKLEHVVENQSDPNMNRSLQNNFETKSSIEEADGCGHADANLHGAENVDFSMSEPKIVDVTSRGDSEVEIVPDWETEKGENEQRHSDDGNLEGILEEEKLDFTLDHFVESDDSTYPYEMDDSSALGGTPVGRGMNVPSTSTKNRDTPFSFLRRISARSTKGKPAEKLNL